MKKIAIITAMLLVVPLVAFATPVPDTGQTKCYDNTQEITCPNTGEPFYGQDAQYVHHPQSYTKLDANGDNLPDEATEWVMVRDNVTGLMWEVKTDDATIHDKDAMYYWSGAQTFVAAINSAQFGGYSDWRLSSVKELMPIVNRDTFPRINISYFPNTIPNWYWASPITPHISYYAWVVYFDSGGVTYGHTSSDEGYVRAVRGEQLTNNFVDNGDGTVTDLSTCLMWQQVTAPGTYNWQQALSYCESLTLAEYSDWRLPDVNEIQSIVDYTQSSPAIDTTYFSNTMSAYYWSSSTDYGAESNAWAFWLDDGAMNSRNKLDSYYVRAVRWGVIDDQDCDGILDEEDNCPDKYNPNQEDIGDSDGVGDACDNCPTIPNGPDSGRCVNTATGAVGLTCMNDGECGTGETCSNNQEDRDHDGTGDACDDDRFCKGLADRDQDVDGADLTMFLSHFGRGFYDNPCPPDGPTPVPKTGQTTSYATGDDGDLERGVALVTPRFTDNGNGTVTDNQTGLMWLREANCFGLRNWNDALSDSNGLADGTCGLTDGSSAGDWRLPNRRELFSLSHDGYYSPALSDTAGTGQWTEGNPFTNVILGSYWSSTSSHNGPGSWAYVVDMDGIIDGYLSIDNKIIIHNVWPVRGGH